MRVLQLDPTAVQPGRRFDQRQTQPVSACVARVIEPAEQEQQNDDEQQRFDKRIDALRLRLQRQFMAR